jgi:hypothetical protein
MWMELYVGAVYFDVQALVTGRSRLHVVDQIVRSMVATPRVR